MSLSSINSGFFYLQSQSKLADQLKKSYSLNDLDMNEDDRAFSPDQHEDIEEEDETGRVCTLVSMSYIFLL